MKEGIYGKTQLKEEFNGTESSFTSAKCIIHRSYQHPHIGKGAGAVAG